jgi:Spy/CpxP family protein refolding chaperone
MPRWVPVALALSLLLNAFFVAGFVFRGWIAPLPFEERTTPPPPAPTARAGALEAVAGELNLDERQRQALRGVFEQQAQLRRERYREMQKVREQIIAEYKRSPLDQARLGPLIDQLGDLRADQQKETVRALAQLEAQLNPEQRQRMHQVLVDRILSSPWSRQPGAPPPSRPSQ